VLNGGLTWGAGGKQEGRDAYGVRGEATGDYRTNNEESGKSTQSLPSQLFGLEIVWQATDGHKLISQIGSPRLIRRTPC
jgi:hypothetical protein